MTENDYQLAWAIYIAAALGCLWVWFYFTGWMWRYLREPLRVIAAVLLFTPTVIDPARGLYTPALAMTSMDLLFTVGHDAWRSVADLVVYGGIAVALYFVFVVLRWLLWRNKATAKVEQQAAQEAAAETAAEEPRLTLQQIMDLEKDSPASDLVARR
ncbi:MAG TPA: MFS transporter [Thiopseudomonas sp.]|nr:MFS transporter [Thiopseudomonas sp.]